MTTGELPRISIIMPAYNAASTIDVAIDSILAQSFRDFEFIIVDDASTDSTWEAIVSRASRDPRIKAIQNASNKKIANSLNRGIELAVGRYIARMDADDWSYPDRLQKQYEYMERYPQIVLSGGTAEICDDRLTVLNKRRYPETDSEIRGKMFYFSPFCHPAIICRADALRRAEGYNHSLVPAEDYDLYFRIGRLGLLGNLPDSIHKLRTHGASTSMSRGKAQERKTLYIRLKAIVEYGYPIGFAGKAYLALQYLSSFIIPYRMKFWLFNLLRGSK